MTIIVTLIHRMSKAIGIGCAPMLLITPVVADVARSAESQIVTAEDGRQVQLNANGSWHYIQRDRYATNARGERFVLSPDGSWRPLLSENPESQASATIPPPSSHFGLRATTADQVSDDPVQLTLMQVVVKKSKTQGLKSVRIDTETHFVVRLYNHSDQSMEIGDVDKRLFDASTSRGRTLKVRDVAFEQAAIAPGKHTDITVKCSGSPRWKFIDHLRLRVEANAVGNQQPYILDRSLRDVEFVDVKSL